MRKPTTQELFDYRAHNTHRESGMTTVKVSKITRALIHQAQDILRRRSKHAPYAPLPDANETLYHLVKRLVDSDGDR